jgi:glutamine synthetase
VTSTPALGLRAADDAAITRELAQAVAFRLGEQVSFAPIHEPKGVGNGTHIHWSFVDGDGSLSFTMRDVDGNFPRWAVTSLPGSYITCPALCAVTAAWVAPTIACVRTAGHR